MVITALNHALFMRPLCREIQRVNRYKLCIATIAYD